jgi:transcriptional antiterminator RfaH
MRASAMTDTAEGQSNQSAQLNWYLVMAKPSNEDCALVNLERQGYGVYFPQLQTKALRRGKWSDRIVPLFPRYLFVQVDSIAQSLAPVRSTLGVANVVRFGVNHMVVPNRVIDSLRANANPETGLHTLRIGEWFKRGDAVLIATGSLTGLEGVFESDDGNHRVTVLLNLLGRETRLQLDAGCVVPSAA